MPTIKSPVLTESEVKHHYRLKDTMGLPCEGIEEETATYSLAEHVGERRGWFSIDAEGKELFMQKPVLVREESG